MQPEFIRPDFIENNRADEIHQRMMNNLPPDIDDLPGGFPYDFTMPAALEKDEWINYHLVRAMMIAFPQYAWDEWLDLHGQQVHLERHSPECASGKVEVTGIPGAVIAEGTIFCTPATDSGASIAFRTTEEAMIGTDGMVLIPVVAVESGKRSNIPAHAVSLMAKPSKNITGVSNPEPIRGGTEREGNDAYYDRIAAEYANSLTFLGNDSDYMRWAKEAGAGDCIVIPAFDGPGTVKLVLVDENGQPANENLIEAVYDWIVSPNDRRARRLPTACARLECVAATMVRISYTCTGLIYNTTTLEQIRKEFLERVQVVYDEAKKNGVLRYNDVRPLLSGIQGVEDFDGFLMNGEMINISLEKEEYPETDVLDFRGKTDEEI